MSAAVDWLGRAKARPGASADDGEVFEPPSDDEACRALQADDIAPFVRVASAHFASLGQTYARAWARWRSDPVTWAHDERQALLTACAMMRLGGREQTLLVEHYGKGTSLREYAQRNGIAEKRALTAHRFTLQDLGAHTLALLSVWQAFADRASRREARA